MIAFMTVRTKTGVRYAANNLQIIRKGWGGDYEKQVLIFECSGVLHQFDVDEIDSVEYGVNESVAMPVGI